MSASENKKLMKDIFEQLSEGDGKPFIESLDDNICWIIMGTTKWSKTYKGKQVVLTELLQPLFAQFADQYKNTAHRFIAEDDYVVIECRGQVTTKMGSPYNNHYCWVCCLAESKLQEIIEYSDTELIASSLSYNP